VEKLRLLEEIRRPTTIPLGDAEQGVGEFSTTVVEHARLLKKNRRQEKKNSKKKVIHTGEQLVGAEGRGSETRWGNWYGPISHGQNSSEEAGKE